MEESTNQAPQQALARRECQAPTGTTVAQEPGTLRLEARLTSSFPCLESHALTFSMQLWSTRFRAMRSVQAYTRDALQLHRPDLGEGHIDPS
jgi:hypothetical protein